MRGQEGKGDYSKIRKRKKTQRETSESETKTKNRGTRTPNEVRQQTSVTCME